jgi:glycosyltransferase involved in cell wall biosynthesis
MSALHNFPTIDDYVKNWQQLSPISQFREVQLSENQHEHRPLVSIITVIFNAASVLEATLESVFQQTYDQIEYILIDGGSTDATLSIIQQYQSQISFYLSEPDRGLYDAMNKGISLCHGQLVGILNAGDV